MKKALGPDESAGGFTPQLAPSGAKGLPIPAIGFHEASSNLKNKIFKSFLKIYATPA